MSNRDSELAWAAGLFEGEGTVCAKRGKGTAHRYQAAIIMTDGDVLLRFHRVIGIGKLYGPYQPTNAKAKPIWRWMTTRNQEIRELHDMIGSWLGARRSERFRAAVADIEAHPAQVFFHKLSAAAHIEIRRRFDAGTITQAALAAEYGVTPSTISVIVRRVRRVNGRKVATR